MCIMEFIISSCICGYHAQGEIWTAVFAQQLFRECKISLHKSSTDETGNAVDRYMHSGNEKGQRYDCGTLIFYK